MKLSIKISLTIGVISMFISAVVAAVSYLHQLDAATQQSQLLVKQLASSARRTSGIAVYLQDIELANEIVVGLTSNDLIANASITSLDGNLNVELEQVNHSVQHIKISLINPFVSGDILGYLEVYPDNGFIRDQASSNSLQTAFLLLALSLITSIIVGLFIRNKLTMPLKSLADEFLKVDVTSPDTLYQVDIGYKNRDEIGLLVRKLNSLITALQTQYQKEHDLRKSTEEMQKRFRLLFEQSTAGIGLLDVNGIVTIANPAFNQLMGEPMTGKILANYFDVPAALNKEINLLNQDLTYSQVGIDLTNSDGIKKRYLHCILSKIKDTRNGIRKSSEQLIEVMIYDVTARREQESRTRYEADHDSLTGLLNRRAGTLKLSQKLAIHVNSESALFAFLMIDLDKFKPINDTHGHDAGDIVLKKISERLKGVSSSYESICIRWGGDEFLVGIKMKQRDKIERYISSVLSLIKQEVIINEGLSVSVGASIGAVIIEKPDTSFVSFEAIIKSADELMYEAKQSGKDNYKLRTI